MNMLQDCPAQVQPKSSSTRQPPVVVDTEEASNILMTLANQQTSLSSCLVKLKEQQQTIGMDEKGNETLNGHLIETKEQQLKSHTNHSSISAYYKDQTRTDPIMLLAAAAAAIDSSNVHERPRKYHGRSYKRREIVIQRRSTDEGLRRPPSHNRHGDDNDDDEDDEDDNDDGDNDHDDDDDRNDYTYTPNGNDAHTNHRNSNSNGNAVDQQRRDPTYALQYLSMKQNPKIKRNAMHAYITYMIYTDLANDSTGIYKKPNTLSLHNTSPPEERNQHTNNKRSSEELDSTPMLPLHVTSSASSPSPSSLNDHLPNHKAQYAHHLSTIDTSTASSSSPFVLPPSPPPTSTPHLNQSPHHHILQQHHHLPHTPLQYQSQYQKQRHQTPTQPPPHSLQHHLPPKQPQAPLLLPPSTSSSNSSSSSSPLHRPLTAFLWESSSTPNPNSSNPPGQNMLPSLSSRSSMILPPLAPPPSSRQRLL
ncbi:hypothetical protein [Absidia glauca]|uniref:Uncharacterized protein n=1 Tax=Absidia glauca TaxID=4829 RepID=A0A163K471_ABSGL|nr:hypothetical protein [Absidia glauca]